LKLWFKDIFLAFSCDAVVEVITAAVIGTSKIVGGKTKIILLLVQSQEHCSGNFIKCILYLFDSLKNETNEWLIQ
jgi:hypothetical protein